MVGIGFLFINDFDTQLRWHVFCLCLFLSSKVECFSRGLECAKLQHLAIGKEVQTCLDMSHVINAGPCLYAVIQDVSLKRKNMSVKLNLNLSRFFFFCWSRRDPGHSRRQILRTPTQFTYIWTISAKSSYFESERPRTESERTAVDHFGSFIQ